MRFGILALALATAFIDHRPALAQPLRPALLGDDSYNESWTLSAEGPDLYVQVVFGVANLGPGSGRATCRVLVLNGKQAWRHQLVASAGDWKHAAAPEPRLELPGCRIRGGNATTYSIEVDEGELTVTLPALGAAAEERLRVNDAKGAPIHRESLLIDEAPAEAVVVQAGATKKIPVTASMLHAVSNEAPQKIAPQWIRVRARDGGDPFSALVLVGGPTTEAWVFERGRPGRRFSSAQRKAKPLGKAAVKMGEDVTAPALRPVTERTNYEPLREMGLIGRVLGSIVGDPLVSVHDGVWSAGGAERRVLLETIIFR